MAKYLCLLFSDSRGLSLLCLLPLKPLSSISRSVLSCNHFVSSGLLSNKLVKIDV